MLNDKQCSAELELLRNKTNKALSGLTPEQLIGAKRVLPVCHRLFDLADALQAEKRRLVEQAPVVCAFCGHESKDLKDARDHINTCKKHPVYEFTRQREEKHKNKLH